MLEANSKFHQSAVQTTGSFEVSEYQSAKEEPKVALLLTMLGALRLAGKVMLCLLLVFSSAALAFTAAETSSAVCRTGLAVFETTSPRRS
jgi:hypothetical protein